jgi:hypothetical protein
LFRQAVASPEVAAEPAARGGREVEGLEGSVSGKRDEKDFTCAEEFFVRLYLNEIKFFENVFFFNFKLAPYTLAGFDLTTQSLLDVINI